jgi:hypothetical protein
MQSFAKKRFDFSMEVTVQAIPADRSVPNMLMPWYWRQNE